MSTRRANTKRHKADRDPRACVGDVVRDSTGLSWVVVAVSDYGPTLESGPLRVSRSWSRFDELYETGASR